jgi:flagellin
MSLINTNLSSLNAQNNLSKSQASLATSMQRLSSGLRVNSSKDDAAGLSIATKMDAQIRGMSQAVRNANDGISLAQTKDGALSTATDVMQRMRELAVQGANGTNTATDSASLNKEFTALGLEVARIATDTKFNNTAVLDSTSVPTNILVGANANQVIAIPASNFQAVALTVTASACTLDSTAAAAGAAATATTPSTTTVLATSQANANTALSTLDAALTSVNTMRADLGAVENRLGYAVSNLQNSAENQSAAKSRIMDTDFAVETANLSRAQVLQQAGTAMVAQANQLPQGVMALLK